jgi:membrane protein
MWKCLRRAASNWLRHRSPRLGAALAYYAVFSLGPLLLIATAVAGLFFGEDAVRGSLSVQFGNLLGENGSRAVDAMIEGAANESSGSAAAGVGVLLLLVAALGVVVQLKDALNTIWEVDEAKGDGMWWYVRTYLVSIAGVLGLGFMLAVSLVLSTALAAMSASLGLSVREGMFWQGAELLISTAVLSLLFALLFKYFPDVPVAWSDAIPGAVLTAILFQVGKLAISWYVGTQGLESTYGAAASVVTLLIWVYYAAQIVIFGAEVTRVHALRRGRAQSKLS